MEPKLQGHLAMLTRQLSAQRSQVNTHVITYPGAPVACTIYSSYSTVSGGSKAAIPHHGVFCSFQPFGACPLFFNLCKLMYTAESSGQLEMHAHLMIWFSGWQAKH